MFFATADLCDQFENDATADLRVAAPIFRAYGGRLAFGGEVVTLKVFEDNARVREVLGEPGEGKVLVIDGEGSLRCALLGDQLGELAEKNAWAGVVIYGCLRDSAEIATQDIGVRALATHPKKTVKRGSGERDVPVTFAGITIRPGEWLYADADGILVAARALV